MLTAQRDPIVTAKAIASLDVLSGGRVCWVWGPAGTSRRCATTAWTRRAASAGCARWPKPVQPSGPAVLVGGNGSKVLERVVRFGDGWYPNFLGDDEKMIARLEKLRVLAAEAGRGEIPTTLQLAPMEPERLARLAEAGVTRVLQYVPSASVAVIEPVLDRYAEQAAAYRSAAG